MTLSATPDPRWKIILTTPLRADRTPATQVGEIVGATGRQFDFNLNRPGMIAFSIPAEAPHAMDIVTHPDGLLTLWRDTTLMMTTEISSLEITGEEDGSHSIGVVAMETMWARFQRALVGESSGGLLGPTSATDQGTWLVTTVLGGINTDTVSSISRHTGIVAGTVVASGNVTGGVWRYVPLMELMQELGASTSGFDFWQVPLDPTAGTAGTGKTGELWVAPLKGSTKAVIVLEYGTEMPNAASFRIVTDTTEMITRAIGLPASFPDSGGLGVLTAFANTRADEVGIREEVIPMEFKVAAFRNALLVNHKDVRKNPRSVFEIQPMPDVSDGRVPVPLVDYTTGDTIKGRVVVNGTNLLNALVRVYGIKIEPTDEGTDVTTVTLVNEA